MDIVTNLEDLEISINLKDNTINEQNTYKWYINFNVFF